MIRRDDRTETTGDLAACLARNERCRRATRNLLMQEQSDNDALTRTMLDAVDLFEELGIAYALVGGLAAMYYGRARYTEDVDFITSGDHEAVLEAHTEQMASHHFDPTCRWKLYHDSGVEIDLWKDAHVDDMVSRAIDAQLAGRVVRIVDVHDLVAMKLRAGRPQDDYDVSEIIKRTTLDESTVRLRVDDEQFERFVSIKQRVS